MRKVLLSLAVGEHAQLLNVGRRSLEGYAIGHGYDWNFGDQIDATRPPSWSKLLMIQRAFDAGYELALWIDADAMIIDPSKDIAKSLGDQHLWGLVRHQNEDGDVPNCGVWLWRRHPVTQAVLNLLWQQTDLIDDPWWEQSAFMRVLGWNGGWADRPVHLRVPTPLFRYVKWLDLEWNSLMSRVEAEHVRIAHFSGLPFDKRLSGMREMAGLVV